MSKDWGLDHVGMSYASTAADLDRDGDLEIITANLDEEVSIYQNNSTNQNTLLVELVGTLSNPNGIGSTIRITTEKSNQSRYVTLTRGYMASGEAISHFGLGSEEKIIELSVQWPSGHIQIFKDLSANQFYTITEPEKNPKAYQKRKRKSYSVH